MNFLSQQSKKIFTNSTRITIKLAIIFFLILAMLIPQQMIKDLVRERQGSQASIERNVAEQIGGAADVKGPILCLPYKSYTEVVSIDEQTKKRFTEVETSIHYAYFTAEELRVNSEVEVTNKTKGIYKIPFFQAENTLQAIFLLPDFSQWSGIKAEDILQEEAFILMGISDLKGISETPTLSVNDNTYSFEPGGNGSELFHSPVHVKLPENSLGETTELSISLKLRGTSALNFASTAKANEVQMTSNWPHPNFESTMNSQAVVYTEQARHGRNNTLPTERIINDEGFTATWQENQFSIEQPGQWLGANGHPSLSDRFMGAEFINVADQYDKTTRSVKYMAMIIALVFVAFFIIELLRANRVHPFQYVLVGSTIAVFFILLLALSEYLGFDVAYVVAAIATTGLIGLYSISVFRNRAMAISISILLLILFAFIFMILTAMEYSLLLGSIGLFLILAAVMYVTRNVRWYGGITSHEES